MPKTPSSSRGLSKIKRRTNRVQNPRKSRKVSPMAAKKEIEVIVIDDDDDDDCPSPENNATPLRTVYCLKNRDQIKNAEENEDCFILEFDPYDDSESSTVSVCDDGDGDDLCVVSAKGQVACRDYPHPRHTCANFPFESTPHDKHCKLCYCYVCDLSAPCEKWEGSSGHCHAFSNEAWNKEKTERRSKAKCTEDIKVVQKGDD